MLHNAEEDQYEVYVSKNGGRGMEIANWCPGDHFEPYINAHVPAPRGKMSYPTAKIKRSLGKSQQSKCHDLHC